MNAPSMPLLMGPVHFARLSLHVEYSEAGSVVLNQVNRPPPVTKTFDHWRDVQAAIRQGFSRAADGMGLPSLRP